MSSPPHQAPFRALLGVIGLRGVLSGGSVVSLGLKAASAALNMLVTIVLARLLGVEGFGVYAFALAFVSLLAIPAQGGLPQLVVRETARAVAAAEWGRMKSLWRWADLAAGSLSLVLILLALSALWLVPIDPAGGDWTLTLLWGLVLVPFVALGNLKGAALRGLGNVIRGQLPELALRHTLLLAFVAALVLFPPVDLAPSTAMAAHAGAAALTFLLAALLLARHAPSIIRTARRASFTSRAWLGSALPLALISGMQVINGSTDVVMLGFMTTEAEVGIYRVAVQAAALVTFALAAVNMIAAPHMARLHAQGQIDALQGVVTSATRFSVVIALPATLLLVVLGGPLLRLLFGDPFGPGAGALALLAVGQLVNATFGSVGVLLNMTGHEWETARGVGIAAGGNVILNLVLIPPFGMLGAASATLATFAVWNVLLWRAVRGKLGVNTLPFGINPRYGRHPHDG